jgi:bis(5'-nucleosyl)-tetraphosphatase (symmetrical)
MATYAIGDVHGCSRTLAALLAELPLDLGRDRLWLAGDLVNRGPDSLGVLRWARDAAERMGERFVAVLGNHDLHFLARAAGVAEARRRDTLEPLLDAPDGEELAAWLRSRPLLHHEGETVLVHAGLLPDWSVEDAEACAREAEVALRGPEASRTLARYAAACGRAGGRGPGDPEPGGERTDRTLAVLTLLRTVDRHGEPCFELTGPPAEAPPGQVPWFEAPGRRSATARAVFGHWAALGLHLAPRVVALDSGCVWGGSLSAVRLEDCRVFQVCCRDPGVSAPRPRPAGPSGA